MSTEQYKIGEVNMKKTKLVVIMILSMLVSILSGCTKSNSGSGSEETKQEKVKVQVFLAASLNTVMEDLAKKYQEKNPNVELVFNADSSGKLLTQIEQGFACDIFFSAAQKQMNQLEADGLIVDGTKKNMVNNQVVVIARKDTDTKVEGLSTLNKAASIALADGSVPVGKYTREALMNLKVLDQTEDASSIETKTIQDKLGVEISEQSNVSKVLEAVKQGNCKVGTTYYSDTYGYENEIKILEKVNQDLTGSVIYPICQVKNDEASEAETKAAKEFYDYVCSDEAKTVFEKYYFDTNVK